MATRVTGWGLTAAGYQEAFSITLAEGAQFQTVTQLLVNLIHAAGYTGAAVKVDRNHDPEIFYGPIPVAPGVRLCPKSMRRGPVSERGESSTVAARSDQVRG